jgi:hypothetical protein
MSHGFRPLFRLILSYSLMRLRKLRIAWSVICAFACLLLVALWIRSYWRSDGVTYFHGSSTFGCESEWGRLLPYSQTLPPVKVKWLAASKDIGGETPQTPHPAFRLVRYPGYFSICIPYWFPATITAALAAAPWLPGWSKRFSLRTLLVATTVVAVVLGLAV